MYLSKMWQALLALAAILACVRGQDPQAVRPYMGWSSWSQQASTRPGLGLSWLREENILRQIEVLSTRLLSFGYNYINLDSGWNADYDWQAGFDRNGRPIPNPERFPRGIAWLADLAHEKGLKLGLYAPVGLPMGVFGSDQDNKINFDVLGTPNCTGFDLIYSDWRTTNGWDSSYKMDFSSPCSQAFIDSIASQFAEWGVDFFKLDGVGPGSWKNGTNYDNRDDVAAWRSALDKTGRDFIFELSWSLDISAISTWTQYADGWRINTDVECYCDTLVRWDASVVQRFYELPPWIQYSGPGRWNDLDTLNVGNGTIDGITDVERQTYATLWAITCSPLYIGDDLDTLDDYGYSLLTNAEVIAINQEGLSAKPVQPDVDQQVWWSRRLAPNNDSYTVALFNLGQDEATVAAFWVDFGFTGSALVYDVWAGMDVATATGGWATRVPRHGSRLLRVTPL